MFPQINQSADMLTPEATQGAAVQGQKNEETPADFNDMLNPAEKGSRSKKLSAIRKAGIRKTAQAEGLPDWMIAQIIDQMEKDASLATMGMGIAKGIGSMFGKAKGLGKGLMSKIRPPKVPVKAPVTTPVKVPAAPSQSPSLRNPNKMRQQLPSQVQPPAPAPPPPPSPTKDFRSFKPGDVKPKAPVVPPGAKAAKRNRPLRDQAPGSTRPTAETVAKTNVKEQRLQDVMSGDYKQQKTFKDILGKEQTGMEKFMGGWGGTAVRDIAPWIVLPAASEMLGLGGAGQLGAFGLAMASPMAFRGKFQGGMIRAKKKYLQGQQAPKPAPAKA